MATIKNKCPNCGAPIVGEIKDNAATCPYCMSKVVFNDGSVKHVIKDEAKVKQVEENAKIIQQELELEKKEMESNRKKTVVRIIASVILGIIVIATGGASLVSIWSLVAIVYIWLFSLVKTKKKRKVKVDLTGDAVEITDNLIYYHDENYGLIASKFETAGFTNIKCIPLGDLNFFQKKENGLVDTISIGGEEDFDEGDIFDKKTPVVITYHSIH